MPVRYGIPQLFVKRIGMLAGFEKAVILPDKLLARIFGYFHKFIIRIPDSPIQVGFADEH